MVVRSGSWSPAPWEEGRMWIGVCYAHCGDSRNVPPTLQLTSGCHNTTNTLLSPHQQIPLTAPSLCEGRDFGKWRDLFRGETFNRKLLKLFVIWRQRLRKFWANCMFHIYIFIPPSCPFPGSPRRVPLLSVRFLTVVGGGGLFLASVRCLLGNVGRLSGRCYKQLYSCYQVGRIVFH